MLRQLWSLPVSLDAIPHLFSCWVFFSLLFMYLYIHPIVLSKSGNTFFATFQTIYQYFLLTQRDLLC